jgi:ribosomal protein S18 acetylase RimI-like enzyme
VGPSVASESATVIRRACEADAPSLVECLHAAFEIYRRQYSEAAYLDTTLDLRSASVRIGSMCVWLATGDTGIVRGTVGWARDSPTTGHLRGMAVRPGYQGSGVAQALLDRVLGEMRTQGLRRATLDTTPPLHRAVRFYERNGFRRTGRVSDYFGMPLIEFSKELGEAEPAGVRNPRTSRLSMLGLLGTGRHDAT